MLDDVTRWSRVKDLFAEASELTPDARDAFLAARCRGDRALRAEVAALLGAHADAGAFLAAPTYGGGAAAPDAATLLDRLQRALAGRFSLEREVGRGGMGIVYLARDVALDRPVAIKLLPPALAADERARDRFLREARTAAGLSHPNIVPVHLVEARDDLVYFVMAYVDGESLGDRVRRGGALRPVDAAKIVQEVAWALGYAHARGVVHRDVKPDNILLDRATDHALVTDFGIARVAAGGGTLAQQGEVLGTFRYMSPEQASGEAAIDGRADLYSLGVTAFLALTARLPFEAESPGALIAQHLAEPAPPLRSVRPDVPARLAEAVDRCLAKEPDARFANGEQLAEAIADAQVTRREIAPTVREFLSVAKNALWQTAGVSLVWWSLTMVSMVGGQLAPLYVILGFFTALVLLRPLHAARSVVRAGFDERDVADAVNANAAARDANVEYELARVERVSGWLSTIWGRGLVGIMGGVAAWAIVTEVLIDRVVRRGELSFETLVIVGGLLVVGPFLFGLAIAPRTVAALLTVGTPENTSALKTLWTSAPARWLFRVAALGLPKRKSLPAPDAAPTEVLLGRAAEELFAQLPAELRTRLGDVRAVVTGLERVATALRVRRAELERALADVGGRDGTTQRAALVADLETARADVDARLARAVSALENLRLDLLRLRAGVGGPDDLTTTLDEASAVAGAIRSEIAARQEVASLSPRT